MLKFSKIKEFLLIYLNGLIAVVKSAAYRKTEAMPEDMELEAQGDFTSEVDNQEVLHYLYSHFSLADREFLDLRYVMEMKDAEVAELMEMPVKTVNKRYQRLLAKCKEILNDDT